MTVQEVKTGFINGNVLDQQTGRSRNVADDEEIMCMAPIPVYMLYGGFERDLDAAMVNEWPMDSSYSSTMHVYALTFLCSCMIKKYIQNYIKEFLSQAQLFGMIPPDARRWANEWLQQLFPMQPIGMTGQKGPT